MICPTGCCAKNLSSPFCKNISVFVRPKSDLKFCHPAPARGAARDRHGRWERDAMDAAASGAIIARTSDVAADGEVVWSWRPDAGAKFAKTLPRLASDGGKRARSPRRARRKPLKPLRRECRLFPVNLWLLTRVLFYAHAAAGASDTWHSLRPLFSLRVVCLNTSGKSCRENADSCLPPLSCPAHAGHPVRRGLSVKHKRLWNTGSPGQAGRRPEAACRGGFSISPDWPGPL